MNLINSKIVVASVAVVLSSICVFADPMPGSSQSPLSPEQAIGNQGQNETVEGVASVTEADGIAGLYVRLNRSPSGTPFVGFISMDNEAMFPDLRELEGRTIDISGVVETMGGIPMIRLTSAGQIKIAN